MDFTRKALLASVVASVVIVGCVAGKPERVRHSWLDGAWADNNGLIPPRPHEPRFVLSRHYPDRQPPAPEAPWNRTLTGQFPDTATVVPYMMELRKYVYDAMLPVNWKAEKIRRGPHGERGWYQAPWMGEAYDTAQLGDRYAVGWPGQDFHHGLYFGTQLGAGTMPGQTGTYDNYEQVFYNDVGGWGLRQMWNDRGEAADLRRFQFPEGTVIAKIVFTSAPATGALTGSPQWTVFVRPSCADPCTTPPEPKETRVTLIQMDIVLKDTRHAPETGWLFSTYVYDSTLVATEPDPWKRMTPLGIMWGNDPGVTQQDSLRETVLNTRAPEWFYTNLGYAGRLSGPIDGARGTGSCMGCHSSAEFNLDPNAKIEQFARMIPPKNLTPADSAFWLYFRNLGGNRAWTDSAGWVGLDYSFVNTGALGHYYAARGQKVGPNPINERRRPPVPEGTARRREQAR